MKLLQRMHGCGLPNWFVQRSWWLAVLLIVVMALVSSPWWLPRLTGWQSDSKKARGGETIQLPQNDQRVRAETDALAGYWWGTVNKVGNNDDTGDWGGKPFLFLFNREDSRCEPMYGQRGGNYGRLYLDPTSSPKKLDWENNDAYGTVRKGVYDLQGDRLRIALARFRAARPTAIEQESSNVEVLTFKRARVESPEYYEKKLLAPEFQWDGPCSNDDHPPKLQAAIALAYIGDAGVPPLLRAIKNESVDIDSIRFALYEIGLPVYDDPYAKDLLRRDPKSLEKWWAENRQRTAADRAKHRFKICLPPVGR